MCCCVCRCRRSAAEVWRAVRVPALLALGAVAVLAGAWTVSHLSIMSVEPVVVSSEAGATLGTGSAADGSRPLPPSPALAAPGDGAAHGPAAKASKSQHEGAVATAGSAVVPAPAPSSSPRFLVAVTTCNQWALTDAAITSLQKVRDPIDVVIVDDRSEDGTAEKARQRGVRVVEVSERWLDETVGLYPRFIRRCCDTPALARVQCPHE